VALAAGAVTLLAFRFARGYPWSLAAIVGIAVVALVGAAFRTYERTAGVWRSEWRRDDDSGAGDGGSDEP
jgi:hypothetical protein